MIKQWSESGDKNAHSNSSSDKLDNNELSEGEAEILVCVTDTMLTATDFLEDSEWQNILNMLQLKAIDHWVFLEINIVKN